MNSERRHKNWVFIGLSLFFLLFFHLVHSSEYNKTGVLFGMNFNLVVYACALVAAFVFFLILRAVLKKLPERFNTGKVAAAIVFLFAVFAAVFLLLVYAAEVIEYKEVGLRAPFLRRNIDSRLLIPIMLMLCTVVFLIIRKNPKFPKWYRPAFAVLVAVAVALLVYAPNFFPDDNARLHHLHAYTNSIVNAANFTPYSDANNSIYGHYGLIYMPFVKLFGNNMQGVLLTTVFFTFVSLLLCFYVLSEHVDNDLHYGIALLAIAATLVTYFGARIYFQGIPHRYLFPMITLAFLTLRLKKRMNDALCVFFEFLLGTLAVVFNLEMGLCCLFVISACRVFEKKRSIVGVLITIAKYLAVCAACFAAAFGIVNGYNLLAGGELIGIKTFIFPMASPEEYNMFEILRLELPGVWSHYIPQVILFAYTAFESVYSIWASGNTPKKYMRLAVSLMGMGSLVYYMNRPVASCIAASHISFVMLLAIYGESGLSARKGMPQSFVDAGKVFSISMSTVAFFLVAWFALEGIAGYGVAALSRSRNVWKTDSFKKSVSTFVEKVPEDTVAFGAGIPELYYHLGWDPQIRITDWSDMNHFGIESLERELKKADSFVMGKTYGNYEVKDTEFEIVDIIETDDFTFAYYERITD